MAARQEQSEELKSTAYCSACGDALHSSAILICYGCLGKECELFAVAAEYDLEEIEEENNEKA